MSDKIDQPPTAEKSAKPEVKFVMPRKWAKRQAPHPQEVWLKVFCAAATACASKPLSEARRALGRDRCYECQAQSYSFAKRPRGKRKSTVV